ncbi:hypothetical protein J1N35_033394 [Gossypium stocksii]|uniref:CWF21 domain-containing protein n=1 Tax=Gossypium stocksii TaxID=47602 RepID=A0A9D3ZP29_9ROSI|nr:hypothetical protein J1N35_033394 [Gossypium stocksii]
MHNGIGLNTPRGSGTNAYTQSNKFFVKPKTNQVELKLVILEDKLVEQGYNESKIPDKLVEARKALEYAQQEKDEEEGVVKPIPTRQQK